MIYTDILQQFVSFFIIAVTLSEAQCPAQAEHDLKLCTSTSLPNFGLGPPADESPPEALKKGIDMARDSCRSEALMEAANCMQNILDKCKGMTEQEQLLQRLFNKDKIIDTVQYFCSNLDVYQQNVKCIREQHPQATNCTEGEQENYSNMYKAGASIDVLILATCEYQDTAQTCLTETVNENCGNDAAVFLETIALALRPPDCKEIKPKYIPNKENPQNSTANIYGVKALIITLIVICLINLFYDNIL